MKPLRFGSVVDSWMPHEVAGCGAATGAAVARRKTRRAPDSSDYDNSIQYKNVIPTEGPTGPSGGICVGGGQRAPVPGAFKRARRSW